MIRTIVFTVILLSGLNVAVAQEHYYWAYGKKHPLELYAEKHYVLMHGQNKASIAQGLGLTEQDITDLKPIIVSRTVNRSRSNISGEDNLYWGFVNRSIDKEKIKSSDIIYAAPSFMVNGKEVSLSHYFYVKLKHEKDFKLLEDLAKQTKVEIVGNDSFMPLWYILSCDKNSKGNALEMANFFYETGHFSSAQPDLMEDYSSNCRNDTFFNRQWHLNNTGQFGGTAGNDTRICQAWEITMGCANVVVAVLDHGLEFNHPDFNNISPISFDTETGTSPSIVRGDHGVAVAGVIGASANNSLGVAGVAPGVQLMSISNSLVLSPLTSQRLSNGINFAWQNGADIINNSWGGNAITQQELINAAIQNATTLGRNGLGTIVVFATGNDNRNSISYPSTNPNIIAVGAMSMCNQRKSPSSCDGENWGSNFGTGLDVMAPGVLISTTDRQGNNGYNPNIRIHPISGGTLVANDYADQNYTTWFNGTSAAAPQVAGIAALILSVNPGLTLQQVRNIIESTTDKAGNYTYTLGAGEQAALTWNNQMGYGRVNAFRAVQAAAATFTISGPSPVCSSGNFTLQNQPVGTTVTWSSSNPNGLTIDPSTGVATRVNNFDGQITITATVNSSCGVANITRDVWVGYPPANMNTLIWTGTRGVNPVSTTPGTTYIFNVDQVPNTTSYTWILPRGFSVLFGGSNTTTEPSIYITTSTTSGTYILHCAANNACGSSWTNALTINNETGGGGPHPLIVYPNPASSILIIEEATTDSESLLGQSRGNAETTEFNVQLFDYHGSLRKSGQSKNRKLEVNTDDLPDGFYILKIMTPLGTEHRHISIKH